MCTRTLSLGPFFFSLLECLSDCSGVGSEIAGVSAPPTSPPRGNFLVSSSAHAHTTYRGDEVKTAFNFPLPLPLLHRARRGGEV